MESPTLNKNLITTKLSSLYLNEKMSDFHFFLDNNKIIIAHKFLLAIGSETFYELFYKIDQKCEMLFLPGIDSDAFLLFLKYFYNENIDLTLDNVKIILELSIKYKVKCLENLCHQFLANNLNDENIFKLLEISTNDNIENIQIKCLTRIGENLPRLFNYTQFIKINLKSLTAILNFDLLNCSETEIYEGVLKWCNNPVTTKNLMREKLGESRFLIRFASMTIEEFDKCLDLPQSILNNGEIVNIFRCILSNGEKLCNFPSIPRLTYKNLKKFEMKSCKRFTSIAEHKFGVGGESTLNFSVNKYLYLCGIEMFGLTEIGILTFNKQKIEIKLIDNVYGILTSKSMTITHTESVKIQKILFDKPILITPTRLYKAVLIRFGSHSLMESFGGTNGQKKVKVNDVIFSYNQHYPENSMHEGPFVGLLFKK